MVENISIFMVEDDKEIALLLSDYLLGFGMSVDVCDDPREALKTLEKNSYDLMVLDLTLPHIDGLTVCEMVTNKFDIPIIISSARDHISDKVLALEKGADDYLPKPYDPRELVARVQAVLRRNSGSESTQEFSDFKIDEASMTISHKTQAMDLTVAEYGLMHLFLKRRGMVLSRDDILDNVEGMNWESGERSIDVIVSRLRLKLQDSSRNSKYIESIRGIGYRMKL